MADRMEFTAKLAGILEVATEQEHRITLEEVEKYFEEDHLSEEQIGLVCEYLMSQKVVVAGFKQRAGQIIEKEESGVSSLSADEKAYVENYLGEIDAMSVRTEEEAALKYYLPKVVEIAIELHHPEVLIGDMIQEGSMALMMSLQKTGESSGIVWEDEEEEEQETLSSEEKETMVLEEVRSGILMMVEEQTETKKRDKKMVNKVSDLDEAIQKMSDEYGRKVAVDEVAERLGISADEISDILKLAGEEAPTEDEITDILRVVGDEDSEEE